jgi:hypothetical protein
MFEMLEMRFIIEAEIFLLFQTMSLFLEVRKGHSMICLFSMQKREVERIIEGVDSAFVLFSLLSKGQQV